MSTPPMPVDEHGTLRAYKRHIRLKEEACRPCKDANAAESRRIWAIPGEKLKRSLYNRAYSRTLISLKNKYNIEFYMMLEDELKQVHKEARENGER